ncbi:MAG: LysR family transcriptional regulator [Pseudomonadota bacterium]
MKLKSLKMIDHFLAASRSGSFHAAARDMSVTQTAITKSIRELENVLGAPLFERSVKGVCLTVFGERFQRRAIQIEQQNKFLERELEELIAGQAGSLRIGAGMVWSDVFLPDLLASFSKTRPNLEITIRRSVGSRFRSLLEDGTIDIGLGLEPSPDEISPDVRFDPLTSIGTRFFVRWDHPLTHIEAVSLSDISAYPWAIYRLDALIFERARRLFFDKSLLVGKPSFLADSSASVMSFVSQTDHITCLPEPMSPMAERFNLKALKQLEGPTFRSGAVYMEAATDYPLIQEILRELKSFTSQNRRVAASSARPQ